MIQESLSTFVTSINVLPRNGFSKIFLSLLSSQGTQSPGCSFYLTPRRTRRKLTMLRVDIGVMSP